MGEAESAERKSPPHRQESFWVNEPLAGVVIELFGSDSQVTWPLFFRMYLYSMTVDAGSVTVIDQVG